MGTVDIVGLYAATVGRRDGPEVTPMDPPFFRHIIHDNTVSVPVCTGMFRSVIKTITVILLTASKSTSYGSGIPL